MTMPDGIPDEIVIAWGDETARAAVALREGATGDELRDALLPYAAATVALMEAAAALLADKPHLHLVEQ